MKLDNNCTRTEGQLSIPFTSLMFFSVSMYAFLTGLIYDILNNYSPYIILSLRLNRLSNGAQMRALIY
jgi:hypothetical protein